MTEEASLDTRTRLLNAAADLIAATPGEDFSLRAVCDAVGVKMPTLYHFFGNKQGLIEAVIERGFDMYLSAKSASESSGDPIQDLRMGWDAHVSFGLENPGFYTLMYGKVRPGYSPEAQSKPSEILRSLTRRAEEQGRLVVCYEQAAAHILATNIGVTLRLIIQGRADPDLSAGVREGVLAAITGTAQASENGQRLGHSVIERAAAHPEILGTAETQLLIQWISRLGESEGSGLGQ
ncbi:MAG: TetR/AcrR family transcriptional regulator [Brevibacterium aurantiacum]|uniref:TetR/AcrR family transcriptional regulator n=1 Tax=Brevibacterium aurantiacum TaxID=273384 RepID=A0A2A3X501_BREAU|nr:TetR/AcrR family transcriptional regulator [Brevibacterium aurantiacum]MDN5594444.1 TetR/AcrR family transcriptional regulator [Brevibacterium sp.]AZL08278.1 TetR/AcrR family transcriptional regulator [Brevibacterium aurantiacum]AZL11869.1 TetR/AcrR family transcriptional regulator [Brevibacterium aurantiacum]AZT92260.1 TetR/AcrR family transcriptional regulator [Brevibacterium aurantiacum]AZT96110.1 TetR/AcrR family transcriptional regulator [Brevibacterium aurantiacum]